MMLKRPIHGVDSTNCMPCAALSKCMISGIVTAKLTMEPIMVTQRVKPLLLSRPMARTIAPNRIGSQIDRLRYGG